MTFHPGFRPGVFDQRFNSHACLDARGQSELSVRVKQVDLTNLLKIKPNRVFSEFQRDGGIFQQFSRILNLNIPPFSAIGGLSVNI